MKNTPSTLVEYEEFRQFLKKSIEHIEAYKAGKIDKTELKKLIVQARTEAGAFHVVYSKTEDRKVKVALIEEILTGYIAQLVSFIESQGQSNSDIKGSVRETFVDLILREILPAINRTGQGEIVDVHGNRSGQMDIVIEYPFMPSLPYQPGLNPRLYLAEGVALSIEVKSDLAVQFDEVLFKAAKILKIEPKVGDVFTFANLRPEEKDAKSGYVDDAPSASHDYLGRGRTYIPLYVITFKGWSTEAKYKEHLEDFPFIEGIFSIEQSLYCSK